MKIQWKCNCGKWVDNCYLEHNHALISDQIILTDYRNLISDDPVIKIEKIKRTFEHETRQIDA